MHKSERADYLGVPTLFINDVDFLINIYELRDKP